MVLNMPDNDKSSIEDSLDLGYEISGCVKYHNGQYGCAIATRNEPADDELLEELREHSDKRTTAIPNAPYTYDFGRF